MPGTVAKVNLTLGALPAFTGVANPADLHGRIHIGPSLDYLEKAFDASKYGEISAEPYLDVTIPSLLDPSLCPPDRHVMSVYVQFAPYRSRVPTGRPPAISWRPPWCARWSDTRPASGTRSSIVRC